MAMFVKLGICTLIAYFIGQKVEDLVAKVRLPGRVHGDLRHVIETCREQAASLAEGNEVIEIDTIKITADDKVAEAIGVVAYFVVFGILLLLLC